MTEEQRRAARNNYCNYTDLLFFSLSVDYFFRQGINLVYEMPEKGAHGDIFPMACFQTTIQSLKLGNLQGYDFSHLSGRKFDL